MKVKVTPQDKKGKHYDQFLIKIVVLLVSRNLTLFLRYLH
eukprot:UN11680